MAKDMRAVFADQLTAEEQIRHTFSANWVPRPGKSSVPAHVAITDRRLLVKQRVAMFRGASAGLDLSQITEVGVGGGLLPKVTVATVGGVGLVLSSVKPSEIRTLQEAVALAKRG